MRKLANAAARLKAKSLAPRRLPVLWLMTDALRLPDPMPTLRRLPRGSGVIVRHTDPVARRRLAEAVRPLCRQRGLICLIAQDWRLAAAVGADGIHLPERFGTHPGAPLLWRRQRKAILTVAAHGARAIARACRLGADAILLAPVFATASHPTAATLGALRFAALVRQARRPVIALGGIRGDNVQRLMLTGASGIAAIGALANRDLAKR